MAQRDAFYDDFYRKKLENVKILEASVKAGNNCLVLEQNLFHPQGGGQKGDKGAVFHDGHTYRIINTLRDRELGETVLISDEPFPEDMPGQFLSCELDWEFRYRQMKLHATVHLHHCLLEKVLARALKPPKTSDIQDGFAFNRYEDKMITPEIAEEATRELSGLIQGGAEITTCPEATQPNFRWWRCQGWQIPCGGTHVKNASEIGQLAMTYASKNGMPTIKFTLSTV